MNCNSIQFVRNCKIFYGIITNFVRLNEKNYCIVQILKYKSQESYSKSITGLVRKHLKTFFAIVEYSNEYMLLEWSDSIRRCIIVDTDNELIVSPCVDFEHD